MDPRLLALPHVAGNLERINIDPRHREAIVARYGAQPGSHAKEGLNKSTHLA
jgi:hypothetical protein